MSFDSNRLRVPLTLVPGRMALGSYAVTSDKPHQLTKRILSCSSNSKIDARSHSSAPKIASIAALKVSSADVARWRWSAR